MSGEVEGTDGLTPWRYGDLSPSIYDTYGNVGADLIAALLIPGAVMNDEDS